MNESMLSVGVWKKWPIIYTHASINKAESIHQDWYTHLDTALVFYYIILIHPYLILMIATPSFISGNWTKAKTDALISWTHKQPEIKTQTNSNAQQLQTVAVAVRSYWLIWLFCYIGENWTSQKKMMLWKHIEKLYCSK